MSERTLKRQRAPPDAARRVGRLLRLCAPRSAGVASVPHWGNVAAFAAILDGSYLSAGKSAGVVEIPGAFTSARGAGSFGLRRGAFQKGAVWRR